MAELLENDNKQIKEKEVHILAKSRSPIDLLENLCIEGTRKQAKCAVKAIVADFGHDALSSLYKRLVDMLGSNEHLPTVLQSLGCIAQTAMPIFKTREDDVLEFIWHKLLRKSSILADISETGWHDRSKECLLKVCGIKTLVRSCLPYKDAQLGQRIKALFELLTKLITIGEISEEVQSSNVDKSHIRLAAAKAVLRLSRQWDCHINTKLFHLTLRTAQDIYPHVRKQFLAKIHRYRKDGNLHHKYACAFVLSTAGGTEHDLLEAKQYLAEFFETCRDTQLHQSSLQSDCNSCRGSPECVLSYLIIALAHHPDFSASNGSLRAEAFEQLYRLLHFFLSVIRHHQDRGKTHDPRKRNKMDTTLIMSVFQAIKRLGDTVYKDKLKNLSPLCDLGLWITKEFARSQVNTGSTYKNGPKDGKYLKLEKPTEQHEENSRSTTEVVLNEVNPDADNIMTTVAEASVPTVAEASVPTVAEASVLPGRKLSRSNKWSVDSNQLRVSRPKRRCKNLELEKPTEQHDEKSPSTIEVVPTEVEPPANNIMTTVEEASVPTVAEASVLPTRKRSRSSKWSGDLASQGNRQSLSAKDSNQLRVSRPKSLDDNCDKFEKCIEKNPPGDEKLSTEKESQDPKSEIVCSHKKKPATRPVSPEKGLTEDGKNHRAAARKILRSKSFSGVEKSSSQKLEKKIGEELVGHSIKVWWPLDKTFYPGFVESYDLKYKKHKVMYHDGDMEDLRLGRERWELIDGGEDTSQKCKI